MTPVGLLQNNSYFAILRISCWQPLAMKMNIIWTFSCEKNLMARNTHSSDTIRCFDKKTITVKFTSDSYINMADWEMRLRRTSTPARHHVESCWSTSLSVPLARCGEKINIKHVSAVCGRVTDMTHATVMSCK